MKRPPYRRVERARYTANLWERLCLCVSTGFHFPEVTKIPEVLESRIEKRWGDQKLVLREPRKCQRASDTSPEASPLVHCFRHLALQERHADRLQPYSAPPCHRHHTQTTTFNTVPTWGQLKHLFQWAEELIERGIYETTPAVMFVAMLAVLAFQPRPSSTKNVHWVYLPNLPFQPVDWMNEPIHVFVNDILLLGRASIYPNYVKTVVSTSFNFSGMSAYPPICFAIPSSLQG